MHVRLLHEVLHCRRILAPPCTLLFEMHKLGLDGVGFGRQRRAWGLAVCHCNGLHHSVCVLDADRPRVHGRLGGWGAAVERVVHLGRGVGARQHNRGALGEGASVWRDARSHRLDHHRRLQRRDRAHRHAVLGRNCLDHRPRLQHHHRHDAHRRLLSRLAPVQRASDLSPGCGRHYCHLRLPRKRPTGRLKRRRRHLDLKWT